MVEQRAKRAIRRDQRPYAEGSPQPPAATPGGRAASEASGQTRPRAVRQSAADTPRWLRSERQRASRNHKEIFGIGGCCSLWSPYVPCAFWSSLSLHSTVVVAVLENQLVAVVHTSKLPLDSHICTRKNRAHVSTPRPPPRRRPPGALGCGRGARGAGPDARRCGRTLVTGEHARVVAELDRATRRIEALKLKLVAAADQAGTAKDAGFTDTNAWVAKTTTVRRSDAARQVALATELDSGHDATAAALDAGLVSPGHAAVIVNATGQLPDGVSDEQRQVVEAHLVEKASRFSPDQLRRVARRAIEAVEPDQSVVDAHENELGPHRGASGASKVLVHAARQRRRHHHRPLHQSPPSPQRSWPRSWTR